ncbi:MULTISPECIES: ABC transporter permease [Petrotoga]|uniref:Peptide/nickel transport system permease protein n=2 Tax=Petrotoga sibirica TaxID=156202 RepID=A0A4R8ES48_9BACT|nr:MULTISPECIES: ABC transporter permease [Petrotoga]POZ89158.1 ABC transporter permease [Petrotoga sibirica DSM 13575]POZ91462.1 ABC transporter permease [Petrotoga sp. SL27]TDX12917.1 peptide/nickel transport system permease protein [Petrotoga sibirica]HAL65236.1 ABC transporter permease [Bacteroidales bacterium]
MKVLKTYIIPRLIQYLLVIFIGITITFIIPRLTPIDPVQSAINRLTSYGGAYMEPEAVASMQNTLKELYGLEGGVVEQYFAFWKHLFTFDFGPSLSMFPTLVTEIIANSLPWTFFLLFFSLIISWIIGNILGGLAGYFKEKKWSNVLAVVAMSIYPIPYYVMALILVILFVYIFPIFPMMGGYSVGIQPSFTWSFFLDVLRHSILPAISLILVGIGWWFLSMRSMTSNIVAEDFVTYAEFAGLPKNKLLYSYVMRNGVLPQITALALQIGGIFNGAIITEVAFSYPGVGSLLQKSITNGDFNLMMGISVLSIIAIATASLIIDLIYPLFDPRIRYR